MAEEPPRAADGRRAAAVFTIVREEAVFLPIWLRYYAAHFAPEDIYVLHHVVPGGLRTGAHRSQLALSRAALACTHQ